MQKEKKEKNLRKKLSG